MGYKPSGSTYNVVFTDHPGLELLCKGTKIGKLIQLQTMNLNLNEQDEEKKLTAFTYFAGRIVRWNMEHPDVDDPEDLSEKGYCVLCGQTPGEVMVPSVKSLLCLELGMVMGLIFGYMSAVAQVTPGKDGSSNGGGRNIQEAVTQRLADMQNQSISLPPNLSSDSSNDSGTAPYVM